MLKNVWSRYKFVLIYHWVCKVLVHTCCLLPEMVRLLIAQAASFCVWNSPLVSWAMIMGMRPASITACTCCLLPAVILLKNQTASYDWKQSFNMLIKIMILKANYICSIFIFKESFSSLYTITKVRKASHKLSIKSTLLKLLNNMTNLVDFFFLVCK